MIKILARHKWVEGCIITESVDEKKSTKLKSYRRFTATIRGFRNWKIYEGFLTNSIAQKVMDKVKKIRDRIDKGDDKVFYEDIC